MDDPLLMLADVARLGKSGPSGGQNSEADKQSDVWADRYSTDHSYLSLAAVDVAVHSTHDYYRRIEQDDCDGFTDHSYAFPIPASVDASPFRLEFDDDIAGTSSSFVNGIALDNLVCRWDECDHTEETVAALESHVVSHLYSDIRSCLWKDCSKSQHKYSHRYLLQRHIRSHIGVEPFECEHCGKTFTTRERSRLHVRTIHESEVNYKCEVCDRFFKTTSDRSHHMTRTHSKLRLICAGCGKLYAGKTVLARHQKLCKGKKAKPTTGEAKKPAKQESTVDL